MDVAVARGEDDDGEQRERGRREVGVHHEEHAGRDRDEEHDDTRPRTRRSPTRVVERVESGPDLTLAPRLHASAFNATRVSWAPSVHLRARVWLRGLLHADIRFPSDSR